MIRALAQPDNDVLHPVYAVTNRLRWVLLAHALVVNALRLDEVAHPVALLLASLVMVAWTPMIGRWQARQATRSWRVMLADFLVSAVLVASSRWVLGREALMASYQAVPVYWMAAAPLVLAVRRGRWWGLASAVALSLAKFVQEPRPDSRVWASLAVMGVSAWGLGCIVDTVRESMKDRDAHHARLAALAERDRLNRIVHDGALQVLAMVEREGPELGPKGQQLAQVARQQETLLRRLLQDRDVDLPTGLQPSQTDVAALLEAHASDTVTVSVMAGEAPIDADRAVELDAAVSEVLTNVAKHAGPGAKAWVLLEMEGDQLIVSLRDNGVGMSREQVEVASTTGRMGIHDSIMGRIGDIGGVAVARSQPGRGVEWEFRIPMEAQ
ncbi:MULTISPECIES: MacS family sensor histidine kinase [unclassified Luteococcus]|uniref:MacS family sensor histidine kinase n=1 Tax=unclassified Luteococcus TaxID=2639923 RepID=UPI00313E4AAD